MPERARRLALLGALAPIWTSSILWASSVSAPGGRLTDNQLVRVEGRLTANRRPVREGYFIPYGARLSLGNGGKAILRFGDVGHVTVFGPANFSLQAGAEPGITLTLGKVLAWLPHMKVPFHVHAPIVSVAAVGGPFFVDAPGNQDTYFCLCSGRARVIEPQERRFKADFESKSHKPVLFRYTSTVGAFQYEAEVEGHSPDDAAELKALNEGRR